MEVRGLAAAEGRPKKVSKLLTQKVFINRLSWRRMRKGDRQYSGPGNVLSPQVKSQLR